MSSNNFAICVTEDDYRTVLACECPIIVEMVCVVPSDWSKNDPENVLISGTVDEGIRFRRSLLDTLDWLADTGQLGTEDYRAVERVGRKVGQALWDSTSV